MATKEAWKKIPGYEYEASTLGRVRSCKTGKTLKSHLRRKHPGRALFYERVGLCRDGAFKGPLPVHRLVLTAFRGQRPPGHVCRHLNGDSLDNRLENLSWGTNQENRADAYSHREDHFLTRADIDLILAHPKRTATDLARELGCHRQTVSNIRTGRHFNGHS